MYAMTLLAVGIVFLALLRHRHQDLLNSERTLEQTLLACRSLLSLIASLQQHRGMSSACLSGDSSFRQRLAAKAGEIESLIPTLREVARQESRQAHPCLTINELALFQFNWEKLRDKLHGLSVEQSIAQHCFLIEQLMQWLVALGESRVELLLGERCTRGVVRNYSSRLPALSECLGMARALGMSVAARRSCSAVARVRLMFLAARAEALLKQANEAAEQGQQAVRAGMAVQQMVRVIRTQMLLSSGISVEPQAYFSIATAAIDGVFSWVGECGDVLRKAGDLNVASGVAVVG